MSEIRPLRPDEYAAAAHIHAYAYPGFSSYTEEALERMAGILRKVHDEAPGVTFYGFFRADTLLGLMGLYDFDMNCLQARVPAGGVGQVAVHLAHKKEHVAKEMMLFYLRHYRQRKMPLLVLYPFRPDFYKKMGFGYGPKMNRYRVLPASLPGDASRDHVRYLIDDDQEDLAACYHRVFERTHGMMAKSEREIKRLFTAEDRHLVGYEEEGRIQGYLAFQFSKGDHFTTNDIAITELVYETRQALSGLLAFLQTQADQIQRITFETQEEYFHYLLHDTRNDSGRVFDSIHHESNEQGVGLMYRVIDVPDVFSRLQNHNFGAQTCTLKLTIDDGFLPENAGSTLLRFQEGKVQVLEDGTADVEIQLDISDLTSLLIGTVDFYSLYRYNLAEITDESYVDIVNRLFVVAQKPVCVSHF